MAAMKKLFCATAAFCLVAAPSFAATKIIFIGNSFTFAAHSPVRYYETDQVHDLNPPDALGRTVGGVPALFKEFTREAGLDYDVSVETVGGVSFAYHMAAKRNVIEGNYDVVVAQGHSTLDEAHPGDPALLIQETKAMAAMYAAINPQVKFYILDSWTHADKVQHAGAPWRVTPAGLMGKEAVYEKAARDAGTHVSGIIPMGLTWNEAIAEGLADDNPYDDAGASKMNLWAYDGLHASSFGYYLEAALDFGKVTGKDPMILATKGRDHVAEDLGISPVQQQQLLQLARDGLAAQGQTFMAMK
jgi:hypothetical protein